MQNYPPSKVCKILKIAKSSYYYRKNHPLKSPYSQEEKDNVYNVFLLHNGSFGRRILKRELLKQEINYSEKKISKILKILELRSKYGRKKGKNIHTSKNTQKYIQENLYSKLSKKLKVCQEIWSMDFTEQKINKKKIYICGIISTNSRILVGFSISTNCTTEVAIKALNNAINNYGVPQMLMTDRGPAFLSKTFYDTLQNYKIQHSMSRPYTPVDNVFIETFWKSLKTEIGNLSLLNEYTYSMVVEYYIHYYNNLRPHSSLNYESPVQHYLNNTVI